MAEEVKRKRGRPRKSAVTIGEPEIDKVEQVKAEVAETAELQEIANEDAELQKATIEGLVDEIGTLTHGTKVALENRDPKLMEAAAKRVNGVKLHFKEKNYRKELKAQGITDKDEVTRMVGEWKLQQAELTPIARNDLIEIIQSTDPQPSDYRTVSDLFYQLQNTRIRLNNQIDANIRGVDNTQLHMDIIAYCYSLVYTMELEEGKVLSVMAGRTPEGRWCISNKGLGPALTCSLLGYLDINKGPHAGNFISYCGLNDNKRPKITTSQADKIMLEIGQGESVLTMEQAIEISARTQWPMKVFDAIDDKGNSAAIRKTVNGEEIITGYSSDAIRKLIVKPPYAKKLKVTCYKVGTSFQKLMNKSTSLYGKLNRDRRIYEAAKNAALEYKDQAEYLLATKNFGKSTEAYKAYSKGMLPPAHIIMRCNRYSTKMFISHLHGEMSYLHTGELPELPWIITHGGHKDYIGPEVPYTLNP